MNHCDIASTEKNIAARSDQRAYSQETSKFSRYVKLNLDDSKLDIASSLRSGSSDRLEYSLYTMQYMEIRLWMLHSTSISMITVKIKKHLLNLPTMLQMLSEFLGSF